ncbi:MAG: GNAT family N-acetyltransferase [Gammaproteobacteria bacterium]|nr:GNAT family N-acetyltransferase [Gammaproteobacteria bacterium]
MSTPVVIEVVPFGGKRYEEVTELRRALLRRPLGLDFTADELARERSDTHVAAIADGRVVGTLLLRSVGPRTVRLMRMAVAEVMQGQDIGSRLVGEAEALMRGRGARTIMMHARATAVGFYERCGYRAVGGSFLEQGIPHIRMEKRL